LLQDQGAHTITQQSGSVRLWLGTQLLYHFSPSVALAAGPDVWVDFIVNDNGARKQWAEVSGQRPIFAGDTPRTGPASKAQYYRVQVGLSISLLIGL
jgi:hypothetical protein